MTCCAPHNVLLEIDSPSGEWEGSLGQNDATEGSRHGNFALRRLSESEAREFGSCEHERASDT